jgi:pilus assembly protein TadC
MNILFWGLTVGVFGKVLVALAILKVHHIMAEERKIDNRVIRSFAFEKTITILGVVAIIIGYMMELYFYGLTPLLTCHGTECTQAASAILSQ